MVTRLLLHPLCLAVAFALLFLMAAEQSGIARPLYKKCWNKVYPNFARESRANCNVCHSGDDKKKLNHYGVAIGKELGEKNVKDEDKIIAAIKAVAKKKCQSDEWGERLEKGLAPCDCKEQDGNSYVARQLHRAEHLPSENVP